MIPLSAPIHNPERRAFRSRRCLHAEAGLGSAAFGITDIALRRVRRLHLCGRCHLADDQRRSPPLESCFGRKAGLNQLPIGPGASHIAPECSAGLSGSPNIRARLHIRSEIGVQIRPRSVEADQWPTRLFRGMADAEREPLTTGQLSGLALSRPFSLRRRAYRHETAQQLTDPIVHLLISGVVQFP